MAEYYYLAQKMSRSCLPLSTLARLHFEHALNFSMEAKAVQQYRCKVTGISLNQYYYRV